MTDRKKPCFCGSDDVALKKDYGIPFYKCSSCGMKYRLVPYPNKHPIRALNRAWNNRPLEAALQEKLDKATEALEKIGNSSLFCKNKKAAWIVAREALAEINGGEDLG